MEPIVDRESLAGIRAAATASRQSFVADLEHLVNIDSGTYTKAGVDVIADWVGRRLGELGAGVVRHRHTQLGDTIVGTFDASGDGGADILLVGHMDTVFEAGTAERRPFRTAGGRAFGPGVGDMKGGLLAGLYAIAALRAVEAGRPARPRGRLVFVANPDEEVGSPSSSAIIRHAAADADVALVLEGARPNGDLVSSRKGMMHARIALRGRAAHAGVEPEKGRSAILEAAHKIVALHDLNARWDGVTLNVGVVAGGSRPNIVADGAVLDVDLRALHRDHMEEAEAAIDAIVADPVVPDVDASMTIASRFWPMAKVAGSQALIDRAVELAAELGITLGDAATGGASDGNTTADAGVPTIDGLGPVAGGAHTDDEYLELDSVVPRTSLVAALLMAIGGDPGFRRRDRA